jgi:hypothetical protein
LSNVEGSFFIEYEKKEDIVRKILEYDFFCICSRNLLNENEWQEGQNIFESFTINTAARSIASSC